MILFSKVDVRSILRVLSVRFHILISKAWMFFLQLFAVYSMQREGFFSDFQDIDVAEAKENIDNGRYGLILDVREPKEYFGDFGHIAGSHLFPVRKLENRVMEFSSYKNKKILVYCGIGGRSSRAAAILAENGFSHVENMAGGIIRWHGKGYPIEK